MYENVLYVLLDWPWYVEHPLRYYKTYCNQQIGCWEKGQHKKQETQN